jgi:hypothetical protein
MDFAENYAFARALYGKNAPGFYASKLTIPDKTFFRQAVLTSYKSLISKFYPNVMGDYLNSPEHYHMFANDKIHKLAFTQKNRTFSRETSNNVLELQIFKSIFSRYPATIFSDWESKSHPDFIWRVIRPGPVDLSPIHSDMWFWEAGLGRMPKFGEYTRVKGWVPILNEVGQSGLSVFPGSQEKMYKPRLQMRDGILKPVVDQRLFEGKMENLVLQYGDIVFFHDNLIHGGFSEGTNTRFSLEFTMMIPGKIS